MGIWKFDLNFANPILIKELNNGSESAGVQFFTLMGDKIFFASDAAGDGFEPWVSDGTEAGTKLVQEIAIGDGSDPIPMSRTTNDKIYVSAKTASGRGLYLLTLP
jgi:ELWxxDGT repeat protein